MKLLIACLIAFVIYLQYALWVGRGGVRDVKKLERAVAEQEADIERLKDRNRSLAAEVLDLKKGLEAIEERARSEIGMIKRGETFFQVIETPLTKAHE